MIGSAAPLAPRPTRRLAWLLVLVGLLALLGLLGRAGLGLASSRATDARAAVSCPVAAPCGPTAAHRTLLASASLGALRPGGGHTYGGGSSSGSSSSGSGSSSSGGGGGGGDLIFALIYLCVEVPEIGIPLLIITIIVFVVAKARQGRRTTDTYEVMTTLPSPDAIRARGPQPWHPTAAAGASLPRPVAGPSAVRAELERLREHDPDFSLVLFEDFLYALYSAAHEARGGDKLFDLRAYLGDGARKALADRACAGVEGVVIGSMGYQKARRRTEAGHEWIDVKVRFESNYTEHYQGGTEQTFYAIEHWQLTRRADAKSKPADKARVLGCPNCGGPQDGATGNVCRYCGQTIVAGVFDWAVVRIDVVGLERRPPQLTGDAPEAGTSDPTVVAPGAEARFRALSERDASFSWGGFQERVSRVFAELQRAWSSQSWEQARPFVTDQLFQMQTYWIQTYQRSRLRNVTENARIVSMAVSDVRSDAHFDAVTLRLFATGLDYTLDEQGKVVSGSRRRERQYSEYWTLIRGRGDHHTAGAAADARICPSCGAPLTITMAGQCSHCQAKVASGEFDWVLSRIEQDESYQV